MFLHLLFIPLHLIPSLSTFCLPLIPLYNMWLSILFALLGCSKKRNIFITIIVRVAAVVRKKKWLSFLKIHNFKFWPVITTTNKALVIILWYSEWINGYDKNLAHVKLLSLTLKRRKFEPFSFFNYWTNNEEQVKIKKVSTIVQISVM